MLKAIRIYRVFNHLSLDVVVGAIVGALFFARIFSVVITSYALIALGLTVWIIYTADHLLDAKKLDQQASTERHKFHQQHFNTLIPVLSVIIILDAITIFFIQREVLGWGVVLAFIVFVYLVFHGSLKFLKEIFIAILYTCGVLLPSLSITRAGLNSAHYILIFQFSILALINLLMFSWFDREGDQRDMRYSFATVAGERNTKISICILLIIEGLLTALQWHLDELKIPALVLGLMGLMLLAIFVFRSIFARHDYYRYLGDAVFILPVIYLL